MRNMLVTGGAGFIGSNFVRYLLAHEPALRVVNLDALTYAGSLENLKDLEGQHRHVFVQGDICDRRLVEDLLRRYAIDTIVHFAAESHVDRSILGPAPFIQTNVVGTFTLLEAARLVWLIEKPPQEEPVRFHHVSTDEVYGSLAPGAPACTEDHRYAPNSPYAASKAASDHLVRAYAPTYGLPVTITNCSNNYGPFQFPEKLIPLALLNALEGKAIPLYGDGGQIRDWVYVEDHCAGILCVLKGGRAGETYHVAAGTQRTNLEVVELLCAVLDERLPDSPHVPHYQAIRFVADRPGHDRRYALDIAKIGRELEWHPHTTLQTGLRQTVDWYLAHSEWVQAIRSRPGYQEWLATNYDRRG